MRLAVESLEPRNLLADVCVPVAEIAVHDTPPITIQLVMCHPAELIEPEEPRVVRVVDADTGEPLPKIDGAALAAETLAQQAQQEELISLRAEVELLRTQVAALTVQIQELQRTLALLLADEPEPTPEPTELITLPTDDSSRVADDLSNIDWNTMTPGRFRRLL